MPCPKLESAFDYKGQIVGTIVGGFLAFRGGDAAKENPARSANPNPATFEHWMRPVTVHAHELLT